MSFSPDLLRRWPDLEGPDLPAMDAADRLILDESSVLRSGAGAGDLVVIGDAYGALTLASVDAGASGVRAHQDPLSGELALAANAERMGLSGFTSLPLDASLVSGARVVLLRLPRSLDALRDIAGLVAAHASSDVVVVAGGRLKHMTHAMNDVLRSFFGTLDVSHARQKSRVLISRGPHDGADPVARRATIDGLVVCAYGGVFAGPAIDIGTRFLLESLPATVPDEVIDFACGSGVVAASLALRHPSLRVFATDQSAAAVASARETALANSVANRVDVVRDDLLSSRAAGSAECIVLNPPFHVGAVVTEDVAPRLFADAARVLRTGGELWCVWNSALHYRPVLERLVGPTRQIARNAKFTVTASARR
ncbi:class I SAM-dependent methyltransferase [Microbacterium sp. ASV49]|uniref:Methyltransferase n=1 Tax=Microbacterium candidum TaxID=3041922 RepID=A0ABT7N1P3_9MICO|nr:class I SAM-dependent methyltransferase [Microbacterium sp. ASV49]MDL9980630.1 methyltransferase [Microbacterium sp. ASV49]